MQKHALRGISSLLSAAGVCFLFSLLLLYLLRFMLLGLETPLNCIHLNGKGPKKYLPIITFIFIHKR